MIGDIHYVSPERAMSGANIDSRTDLYNLGALLYALLTGKPPIQGEGVMDTLMKIPSVAANSTREFQMSIPASFDGLVLKLLAKKPQDRYQSAAVVIEEPDRNGEFANVV